MRINCRRGCCVMLSSSHSHIQDPPCAAGAHLPEAYSGYHIMKAQGAGKACVAVLPWLQKYCLSCAPNKTLSATATADGRLDVLQYLHDKMAPALCDADLCTTAAFHAYLGVLKWLRIHIPQCPWNAATCTAAVSPGHLLIYKWLRNQQPPCPVEAATFHAAAAGGHVDVFD